MGNQDKDTKPAKTVEEVIRDIDYIIYPEIGSPSSSGLYDYFRETFGGRSDWGEFERLYQERLEDALLVNQSGILEDLLNYKQEKLNLRMELEGLKDKYNIRKDPNIIAAAQEEAAQIAMSEYSGIAAAMAYDIYKTHNLKDYSAQEKDKHREAGIAADAKKRQDALNEAQIQKLAASAAEEGLHYLVRGAPLLCNCGTHSRHLDMPESHGFYINGYPVVFEEDCVPDINIMYFGHCNSYDHPEEKIELKMGAMVDAEGNYLAEPDTSIVEHFKCIPKFSGPWENAHEPSVIAESVSGGPAGVDGAVYKRALTTASYIVCEHGGLVVPLTSGQYEASMYEAPFKDYPFEDFGSEVFKKWCEQNNIIPHNPGESEYMTKAIEKLEAIEQKGKELERDNAQWLERMARFSPSGAGQAPGCVSPYHAKIAANQIKKKELYEQILDQGYTKGLDTMPGEEADKFQGLLQEYLDSGLLTDKEKEDAKQRYGGLRLPYGASANAKAQETYEAAELDRESLEAMEKLLEQYNVQTANGGFDGQMWDYLNNEKPAYEGGKAYDKFMDELSRYGSGDVKEEADKFTG